MGFMQGCLHVEPLNFERESVGGAADDGRRSSSRVELDLGEDGGTTVRILAPFLKKLFFYFVTRPNKIG
jgi:hypothetical protein